MATIPSTELIHAEIVAKGIIAAGGSGSKVITSVWQFRRTNVALAVDKANIEDAFQAAYMVPLLALLNDGYTQQTNGVRFLNDATDPPLDVTRAVAGGIAGERTQAFDSVVFQLITAFKGKSGRGSKHLGPLSEADTVGDILAAGVLAAWQALKATFLAGFTDSDGNVWVPCVVIRNPAEPKPRSQLLINPTTVLANDVISVRLNRTLGTMRRRKAKTVTA